MIYFPMAFPATMISGGIRVVYSHVDILNRAGIAAAVINPDGHPTWFGSDTPVLREVPAAFNPGDQAVLPEAFIADNPLYARILGAPELTRHCFCQNHFYVFYGAAACARTRELGITGVYAASVTIARYLEAAFGLRAVPVVPCTVDSTLFHPDDEKTLTIAYMPRKQGRLALYLRDLFRHRHPDLASVEWVAIEGRDQVDVAAILRRTGIFLSLSQNEGFGLPPVEAMAAGCLVVGFHGGGGREYATAANGLWFEPDQLLECADALATAVRGLASGSGTMAEMRRQAGLTAGHYSRERTTAALLAYFRPVCAALPS